MVFRRRTFRRKRRFVRKRYVKRKRFIPRPIGRSHRFVRGVLLGTVSSAAAATTYAAYSFALSDVPNYTEFTNLFDEYRISKVILTFVPQCMTTTSNPIYTTSWLIYVVDKDDASTPTSYTSLQEYPKHKVLSANRRFYVSFRPRFSTEVYASPATTGYGSRTGWLDCSNAGIPHYGFKLAMGLSGTAGAFSYAVFAKYVIDCHGVR